MTVDEALKYIISMGVVRAQGESVSPERGGRSAARDPEKMNDAHDYCGASTAASSTRPSRCPAGRTAAATTAA